MPFLTLLVREGHQQMELAVATPMDMMAPIKDGTLNVVWVRNSARTI